MYVRPHRDAGKSVGCMLCYARCDPPVPDGRKIQILHFSLVSFAHACMFALHCAALRVSSRVCVVGGSNKM